MELAAKPQTTGVCQAGTAPGAQPCLLSQAGTQGVETGIARSCREVLSFDSALQGDRKTRQTIFEDVVHHTVLRTFDRIFFGEHAGDQEKRGVVTGLAQVGESVETSPPGQRVSSEDCGKFLRGERGFKVRALFNDSGLDGNAGVAEFAKNRSGVVRGMFEQQNAERRSEQRRFELFGRSGFHERDPSEWDRCK